MPWIVLLGMRNGPVLDSLKRLKLPVGRSLHELHQLEPGTHAKDIELRSVCWVSAEHSGSCRTEKIV